MLSLRLYSTAVYKTINGPLRDTKRTGPHPLAITVSFVDEGVRRLTLTLTLNLTLTLTLTLTLPLPQTLTQALVHACCAQRLGCMYLEALVAPLEGSAAPRHRCQRRRGHRAGRPNPNPSPDPSPSPNPNPS